MRGELLTEYIRFGTDAADQFMESVDITLGGFQFVAELLHPFES